MSEDDGGESRVRTYSEWEVISSITPPPEEVKHLLPPTPNTVSHFRPALAVRPRCPLQESDACDNERSWPASDNEYLGSVAFPE